MKDSGIIVLQSMTYATKARILLLKNNINSDVVKTPKIDGVTTCSYSLNIKSNFDIALKLLLSKGFKVIATADSDLL